jgi:hypothetical protein
MLMVSSAREHALPHFLRGGWGLTNLLKLSNVTTVLGGVSISHRYNGRDAACPQTGCERTSDGCRTKRRTFRSRGTPYLQCWQATRD